MEVANAETENGIKVVIDNKKEYCVSEATGDAPSKHLLVFPLPAEENNHYSLILYVNQSLMTASDGMRELDGFNFGIKAPFELQPKGFESIQNPIPALIGMGC